MSDKVIEITTKNEVNPLDAIARVIMILRKSGIKVKGIIVAMENFEGKMLVKVEGDENTISWTCAKLSKLYDVINVKYLDSSRKGSYGEDI